MIERRSPRRALVTIAVAALVAIASPARAQTPEPPATASDVRTFSVRALRLSAETSITFHLHPRVRPIELRADTDADLVACPEGWPTFTGFVECLPFVDGALDLPSVVVDSFHLGFTVKLADGTAASITKLDVTYGPTDGYFLVAPPPLAPGATTTFSFVPTRSTTVGVGAYARSSDLRSVSPDARVRVRQLGSRVRRAATATPGGRSPNYGPVEIGERVHVQVRSTATASLALDIAIDWD